MNSNNSRYFWVLIIVVACVFSEGCTEPYAFDEEAFDEVLIVDGSVSNQHKKHKISLSRSYAFDGIPTMEKGAVVQVRTNKGDRFNFKEQKEGIYEAEVPFAAVADEKYTLEITTLEGKHYESTPMMLPEPAALEQVYAEAAVNDRGEEGISILLDAASASNQSRLYRFEYEETYKIVAPYWTPYDAIVVFEGTSTFATDIILRETEEQTCYGTALSERIQLRSTLNQTQDRLQKEPVHFLPLNDPKLQHRYSVLVRLLVESAPTYSYFETLKDLSVTSSAFFTEKQPGYIAGNMKNREDSSEKVAGFFRVSAVAEKRIFFNLNDFYPEAKTPDYFISCTQFAPSTEGSRGNRNLLNTIYSGYGRFYKLKTGEFPGGPYIFITTQCGDCTVLGSNRVPEFWIP